MVWWEGFSHAQCLVSLPALANLLETIKSQEKALGLLGSKSLPSDGQAAEGDLSSTPSLSYSGTETDEDDESDVEEYDWASR